MFFSPPQDRPTDVAGQTGRFNGGVLEPFADVSDVDPSAQIDFDTVLVSGPKLYSLKF